MKRLFTLTLLFCFLMNGLLAQKKADNPIQPYFALMTGYAINPEGNAISVNSEYQYRYKNIGIGVGLGFEYATSKNGGGLRYPVGKTISRWNPSGHNAFQSTEYWLNIIPSLVGYYYVGQKHKWEGFFKSGILANYNAWYSYNGLEYKTDQTGKVIEEGFTTVNQTINSIDLQSINWLIGGGVQYQMSKMMSLRISSEIQWERGVLILGGVVFKI